jgi:16S rRNA (uracil1498-N3)-methyltransferase
VGGGGGAPVITVLVPRGVTAGRREELEEGERHHLRVRRARAGEMVALRDGAGLVGTGRLAESGREWLVDVDAVERRPRPAELTLAVGAGDRERFGWMIVRAAELGVTRLVPIESERTSGVASRLREAHLTRLRRQALEAVKQCGAAWALELEPPVPLADFAARPRTGAAWLADAEGAPPPAELAGDRVSVVIGPEGGLSAAERATLRSAGFDLVVLAPHTLRFETAALAAAAAVATARLRGIHG